MLPKKVWTLLFFVLITGVAITVFSNSKSRQFIEKRMAPPSGGFSFVTGPTPTPTPRYKLPPKSVILAGARWIPQTFNNCGPATVSMVLQYFGFNISQQETQQALRTNPNDTNVFTYEIRDYLKSRYDIDSKLLYNGNVQLLKTLIANGFYIIIENWLHPNEDIGHFVIIRGYDDVQGVFIADDSFIGTNVAFPYEQFTDMQWKSFDYEYLPIYKKEMEGVVRSIVGEDWDEKTMYRNAVSRNKEATAKNQNDMYAWFNIGTAQYALGNYADARTAFEKSRSLGWPGRMLWYQIQPVQTYNKLGDYVKALELAQIGLQNNDLFNELLLEEAIAYKGLGQTDKAKEAIRKALQAAPNYTPAIEFSKSL